MSDITLYAHRGSNPYADHSREAYVWAVNWGADVIEPDLFLTKDGVLVASHDNHNYSNLTYAEAKAAQPALMTFGEVIELAKAMSIETGREIGIIPETKNTNYATSEAVIKELIAHDFTDPNRVVIQSFASGNLQQLHNTIMPQYGVDFPLAFLGYSMANLDQVATYADIIAPHHSVITAEGVAAAHAAGLKVVAWTIKGTQEQIQKLIDMGVDGVFVDETNTAREALSTINGVKVVYGTEADDQVSGNAGNDLIYAMKGDDTVKAGAGDDLVYGDGGDDTIDGEAGNDTLVGGAGDDKLNGGAGNDTLNGGAGIDIINGGDGNDLISGGEGNDNLQGAAGIDEIHGGDGDDRINGGGSADILFGDAGKDLIYGSDGNDEIHGGADNDQLHGEGGNDTISGDAGNDTFYGGIGQDTLIGGDGNDQVYGQDGNDTLMGGAGFDKLDGGSGIDTADYSQNGEGIYARLDQKWAIAQADRASSWADTVAGINGNTIVHDDLISIENITGTAFNDALIGDSGDNVIKGGAGNDYIGGLGGNDILDGGDGNDTIVAGAGDTVIGGAGNDTVEVAIDAGTPASIDGGEGTDTVKLLGTGTGALGATTAVETLLVQEGTWSVAASDYSSITIENGATLTSPVALNNNDHLTIDAGGKLTGAISRSGNGDIVVDNSGLIEVSGRVLNGGSSTGTLTLNNLAGATIKQIGSNTDVIRPGQNGTVNNWGTITTGDGFAGGGDLIDFQGNTGGKVNNHAGGWMEGSRHAVTGDRSVTVVNDGMMIGRNGSAVNIDNGGSEAEKVFITNRGTMEGRSAGLSDSDGDAVDVDGLVQVLNYGRIAGLGANGRHDGEPNVSEGIAIGGGTILNYGANAEIYGYGRAIQVDNSSNSNALGKTFINNQGLIQGDGHGPEGVTLTPAEVAKFDLRGNEAINLIGDYADEIINGSTGRIVGGVSMGGGNDHLQSMGSFTATGGSAIDMGAGNDTVYFYTGTTVQGSVLLGTGDDLLLSTAAGGFVIDAGDGNDQIYLDSSYSGNDVIAGGAGDDTIYAGAGNDQINGGEGNDTLSGQNGDDVIDGGAGDDHIMGGNGADTLRGGEGNDRIEAGAGDIVEGGAGDDIVEISVADGSPVLIDGGEGDDTVNLYATPGSTATGGIGQTSNVETMNVVSGNWTLDYFFDGANLNVHGGAAIVSAISLEGGQTLTVEQGGLVQGAKTAIWISGGDVDAVVVNNGTINVTAAPGTSKADAISLNGATATIHNGSTGVIEGGRHAITGPLGITVINDAGGLIVGNNGSAVNMDNGPDVDRTAYVTNYGTMLGRSANINDSDGDAIDVDGLATINNYGMIRGEGHNGYHKGEANVSEGIAIGGGVINNYANGTIYGYGRAIQVDNSSNGAAYASTTIYNEGTIQGDGHAPTNVAAAHAAAMLAKIVGGEAISIVGTYADTITNKGTIIGGIKTDGGDDRLTNSGAITATGGSAVNMGADNDSLANSGTIIGDVLMGGGNDTLVNDGQMSTTGGSAVDMGEGDDLIVNRGTMTGNVLTGAGNDEVINVSTGRIIGDVVMGAGQDKLGQSGLITGDVDMGDGDDVVNLYVGASVGGAILLGAGNDLLLSTADSDFVIDAGDGDDQIYVSGYTGGDDVISGGAGEDRIYSGLGEDRIDGGADNDSLYGEAGDDLILGGTGNDIIDGGADDDVIYGDAGNDTLIGGLGNDVIKGGIGNDTFVITSTADGHDSYDGGEGIDTLDYSAVSTAVNLTLKDGVTTYQTDTIENVENVSGGSANDKLTGNSLDNVLTGNAGDDTLKGGAGNDTLDGGAGIDNLDGGVGNDQLSGGLNDDVLKGVAGEDHLDGGEGNDDLDGGADNDTLTGGLGDDVLKGGAGNDVIIGGAGNDTLTGGGGFDQYLFSSVGDGIDTITDFKTSGTSEDQFVLSASMFQNFSGDDAFDLIGSGFLRAVSSNGTTQIQVDIDGGGDSFVTLAMLTGNMSNGVLADHVVIHQDPIA